MSFVCAKSLKPPAIASTCRIEIGPFIDWGPGLLTSPITKTVAGVRFDDDDRDHRVGDVLAQRGGQRVAQLCRRLAGRGDVAEQRQRDLSVRPDLQGLRELRVFVDLDPQLVARDEPVVRRDGRGRGLRCLRRCRLRRCRLRRGRLRRVLRRCRLRRCRPRRCDRAGSAHRLRRDRAQQDHEREGRCGSDRHAHNSLTSNARWMHCPAARAGASPYEWRRRETAFRRQLHGSDSTLRPPRWRWGRQIGSARVASAAVR